MQCLVDCVLPTTTNLMRTFRFSNETICLVCFGRISYLVAAGGSLSQLVNTRKWLKFLNVMQFLDAVSIYVHGSYDVFDNLICRIYVHGSYDVFKNLILKMTSIYCARRAISSLNTAFHLMCMPSQLFIVGCHPFFNIMQHCHCW